MSSPWRKRISGSRPDGILVGLSKEPDGFSPVGPATDPGLTHGLIAKRSGPAAQGPLNSFRFTISVRSIADSVAAIQAAGGTIRGHMADIPNVGQVVEFADTDGARAESFTLPRPRSDRARKLADYLTARPDDSRSLDLVAGEVGGASLRTFERLFLEETGLSLAAWRRQSRLLTSLSLLAEGKSIGEVARAVGYDSAAAFSTAFKQCFGMPPSSYASNAD